MSMENFRLTQTHPSGEHATHLMEPTFLGVLGAFSSLRAIWVQCVRCVAPLSRSTKHFLI
jgi:hypothetical protein